MIPQKLPQHWAAEAAKLETHEERAAFVKNNVPEHFQDAVIYHLKVRREWLKHYDKQRREKARGTTEVKRGAKKRTVRKVPEKRKDSRTWVPRNY